MSAPARGPRGGTTGGRATPPQGPRGRDAGRGSTLGQLRGQGGRGRGAGSTMNARAEGLLQGLQAGSLNKRGESGGARAGRGERKQSLPRERVALCPRPSLGYQIVLSHKMQPPSATLAYPRKAIHLLHGAHLDRQEVVAPRRAGRTLFWSKRPVPRLGQTPPTRTSWPK